MIMRTNSINYLTIFRMMTSKEYEIRRDELLRQQAPFVVMEKNGLVAEGENYYRIGDVPVEVTAEVQSELDLLIGLKSKQSNGFRDAYGDRAVAGLRNSFAMADSVSDSRKFVLIANPSERIVDGIVPIREEVIPMRSFFDVVEIFADKHGYEVDQLQSYGNAVYGIIVRLMPVRPQYDAPVLDDEFVTNGLYMKWNIGEIELGSYYLRLVCLNGQMQLSEKALEHVHRIDDRRVEELLCAPDKAGVIARNWDAFKHAVNIADETTASLAEVQYGKKLLLRHGAPENLAEQLMPYSRLLEMYGAQGLHVPARQAKSDINMYELFNRLTDFASHTTLWEQNDSRSSSLMQDSMEFLMRKRDIRNYYDIFSDRAV